MVDKGSVSQNIQAFRDGDSAALNELWKRYYDALLKAARRQLGTSNRGRTLDDEEDVVVHVFNAFYRATRAGRYPDVTNRDSLWRLLLRIAVNKVRDVRRRPRRLKHGAGRELGESALATGKADEGDHAINNVVGREPSPDFALIVAQSLEEWFSELDDPKLRTIVELKMQGFENHEIGVSLNCSERTIERKVALIRKIWVSSGLSP